MSRKKPNGYWSKERIAAAALMVQDRREFKTSYPAFYWAAVNHRMLDELFTPRSFPRKWSVAKCAASALAYRTQAEWVRGDYNAYDAAHRNGWLGECCAHMVKKDMVPRGYWTFDRCKASAARYATRNAWQFGDAKAYDAAHHSSWLDLCCAHMDTVYSPRDCVYLWQAKGVHFNGSPVYKIGITALHRGRFRVERVAKAAGVGFKLLRLAYVVGLSAATLEAQLLALGVDPKLDVPQGRTEFRALTDTELKTALAMIDAARF